MMLKFQVGGRHKHLCYKQVEYKGIYTIGDHFSSIVAKQIAFIHSENLFHIYHL